LELDRLPKPVRVFADIQAVDRLETARIPESRPIEAAVRTAALQAAADKGIRRAWNRSTPGLRAMGCAQHGRGPER